MLVVVVVRVVLLVVAVSVAVPMPEPVPIVVMGLWGARTIPVVPHCLERLLSHIGCGAVDGWQQPDRDWLIKRSHDRPKLS
ncbi:hypothetical protein GGR51DRAFT_496948 [Nemania sp. FL0031]|nr:hypothetical protein GGR51DRAFT_496948 [Nemania sp. FL0031]